MAKDATRKLAQMKGRLTKSGLQFVKSMRERRELSDIYSKLIRLWQLYVKRFADRLKQQ